jgi:hypothetical protein
VQRVRHPPSPVVELGVGARLTTQAKRDLVGAEASLGNHTGVHP